jgi:FtsH-binding integral membrane protein
MQQPYYNGAYSAGADESAVNAYVAKVFGWMFVGLMITCLSTLVIMYGINVSEAFAAFIGGAMQLSMSVFVAEVILVWYMSARVAKMNPGTAKALYVLYSVLNGLTFGLVAVLYAVQTGGGMYTLGMAFGITAVSFGIMAVYGLVTKADITRFGNLLRMGLFGLIIIMVVNFFMKSAQMDYFICIAGLFIFLGLTAYDTKMIKSYYAQVALNGPEEGSGYEGVGREALASNLAIVGALKLYLDFINMFLFILRLFGNRR